MVLAINRLYTDFTGVQYLAANENRMINEVSTCFKTSGVQHGPVDCTQYNLLLLCLLQNSRLIVVDAKEITKKLLYKSNVVNPNYYPVNNVCLLLFNKHYYSLTSLSAWHGLQYYVLNVKYVIIVITPVNQLEYVLNAQRKTVCPSPHLPDVTASVLALFAIVHASEISWEIM